MAKKPCGRPGCPALVVKGYCEAHRKHSSAARYEAARADKPSKKWYSSARWQKRRAGHLRNSPLCVDPYGFHQGRYETATDADHIVPHREDYELFWNGELQSLCHSCHSYKTAKEDGGFGHKSNGLSVGVRGSKSLESMPT